MHLWIFSSIHLYIYPKKHIPVCLKCPAIKHVEVWKVVRILGEEGLMIKHQLAKWSHKPRILVFPLSHKIFNCKQPCSTYWWHTHVTADPDGISQLLRLMSCRDFDSRYVWCCEWSVKICIFHISHRWNWKFICKYFEDYSSRLEIVLLTWEGTLDQRFPWSLKNCPVFGVNRAIAPAER